MELERNIAAFLGTESAIIYSQAFSTISSVIPAFCKRGDIIIADRGVNFAIHLGIKLSRSTIRWYDHNDMASLEEVAQSVAKEVKKKRLPLTRQFIITEGIFENDGLVSDLPKLVRFVPTIAVPRLTNLIAVGRAQEQIQIPLVAGRELFIWHRWTHRSRPY